MLYFSGFALQNESELFDFWLPQTQYCVVGFSYGAIKAVEYLLETHKRVDRLLLLSPAYFNNKSEAFKKMQLLYYKKDPYKYRENFLKNISFGSEISLTKYLGPLPPLDDLKELLYYNWSGNKLKTLQKRGILIEVILGGKDKIIDASAAREFFQDYALTYYIKDANHILKVITETTNSLDF